MSATLAKKYADAIPFAKASAFVPGRPNISTLHRWAGKGVRGVKLATIMVGGRRYVTLQALEEFLAALNADSPPVESKSDVARRAREASQALERLGC